MKVNNIIFMIGLLIGLIGLTTNHVNAQIDVCNTDATFTATATSAGGEPNMDYMLVQSDGVTIEASNNTGTFSVPADGSYTLYAVNHDGTANLTVVPPTGACLEFVFQAVTVSNAACPPPPAISACENESFTATATSTGGEPNMDYMLVCGGVVVSTNSTGTFDLEALGVAPGTCDLYAVNHDGTANLAVAPPTGTCLEYSSRVLNVLDAPDLMVTASINGACGASTADLTSAVTDADGGTLTYFESDGTTPVATPTMVVAGNYVITSTSGTCSDSETVTVALLVEPDLMVSASITNACPALTADLTTAVTDADGGTLSYFESDGITSVIDPTAVATGMNYIIRSTLGTCSDDETVMVTATTCSSGLSACENESVSATATAVGGEPNTDYMLVCGGAVISSNSTGTFDLDALGVSSGNCDLYAVNHDGTANLTVAPPTGSCVAFITQSLTVLDAPDLTVNSTLSNACPATTADLTSAVTSTGGGTVSYFESDGITSVGDPTAVGAGTYVVSSTDGTCTETANITVTIISCAGSSVCEHEILMVSASNANVADPGYVLEYMLVCGGSVTSVNSTGMFDMDALGVVAGTACDVYAVNHDGTANMAVAPPTGTCVEYIDQPVTVLESTNGLCNTPVPVELMSFNGQAEGKVNVLYWSTATEINSDYFDVEHSANGEAFTHIGTVEAQGYSIDKFDYRLVDDSPKELSYYRLKMVDLDETYEYSNIVAIKRDGIANSLSISSIRPTPTKSEAVIEFTTLLEGEVNFMVTDIAGRILAQETINATEGLNQYTYDFSDFASAVYIVSMNNDNARDVMRIVKN